MPIVWLVARCAFVYAGQQLVPGEVFATHSLHDADLLVLAKQAVKAPGQPILDADMIESLDRADA